VFNFPRNPHSVRTGFPIWEAWPKTKQPHFLNRIREIPLPKSGNELGETGLTGFAAWRFLIPCVKPDGVHSRCNGDMLEMGFLKTDIP